LQVNHYIDWLMREQELQLCAKQGYEESLATHLT